MKYLSAHSGAVLVIAGMLALTPWLRAQPPAVNALSQHYDRSRAGATLVETILNTTTVASGRFGKLWTLYADGQQVGEGRVEGTVPVVFSADETADVGSDTSTTVSDDYTPETSRFTGRIHWVQLDID